jgi:hypothetical protein
MATTKNSYRSKEAERLFKAPEYKLVNGKTVKFTDVKVHEFNMGDVEDPDLYASQPLWEWQQTDAGQWVMAHAVETPFWHRVVNPYTFGWTYHVVARLEEKDQLYWKLKWSR